MHTIGKSYEQNNITCILITDLSKTFNTIDHAILLKKLEHYGIRGIYLTLMQSYLSNRQQLVEIDTYRSKIIQSEDCSVVQGSKLSGILYTIYTNEIPILFKIMNMDIFTTITGQPKMDIKDIKHETTNFVDDSTNIIMTKTIDNIEEYINKFYILLGCIYTINMLSINNDKTELMICCKNRDRKHVKRIKITTSGYTVKQVTKVKILGVIIQSNLKNNCQINKIISNLNNRLYNI